MGAKSAYLLKDKRFLPFFLTQFLVLLMIMRLNYRCLL